MPRATACWPRPSSAAWSGALDGTPIPQTRSRSASFSSVMAFSEPSDAILLQLPSYPPFMRAFEDTGRRLIASRMRDDGTRWLLDLGAYEAAHDPRLRMLIFCHPQNPTGRAFRQAELEEVRTSRSGMIW